jgi:lipopolysaccharide export system permease protein
MSLIVALLGEYVLPRSEAKRAYVYNVLIKDEQPEDQKLKARIHFQDKNGTFYYFGFFDGYKNSLRILDMTKFDHKTGQISERITASAAQWKAGMWILQDCEVRKFSNHQPVSWKHYGSTVLPGMDVKPEDFIRITKKTMAMNYWELRDYIGRLKKVGDKYNKELVDLHLKIAFPLTNLIVIFFFIPIATTSTRSKGRGWIFMLGLLVCFLYMILMRISQSLGYNEILSPLVAAWAPNILFAIIGYGFLLKAEI